MHYSKLLQALQDIARHTEPERYHFWTDLGLAIGTIALAIGTVFLACFTARVFHATKKLAETTAQLAKDTAGASTLADIHHQESQAPIVVWNGSRIVYFDAELPLLGHPPEIQLHGVLANIGFGPALCVTVAIYFANGEAITQTIGTLAEGECVPDPKTTMERNFFFRKKSWQHSPTKVEIFYATAYGRTRKVTYSNPEGLVTAYEFPEGEVDLNRDERITSLTAGSSEVKSPSVEVSFSAR
jgi:hypothetical protein